MSTQVEGIVLDADWSEALSGVTVYALSTNGYTEGSGTTDSNGYFVITGLTDRAWMAKLAPGTVGNILLTPVDLAPPDHGEIVGVEPDQHHELAHFVEHHTGGDQALSLGLIAGTVAAAGHGDQATDALAVHALMSDADGDTLIQLEEAADEDKVRIDTGGAERAVIDSSGLNITGSIVVSGTVDGVDIAARDHAEAHTVASHSDTTATGAETETLTDGSDASALHTHGTHSTAHEGTAIKSTGEGGGTKFLREDGDGTCSWQAAGGGSGSMTTVKHDTVQVGGADIVTLDFGAGLDASEDPDTEINVTVETATTGNLGGVSLATVAQANTGTEAGAYACTPDSIGSPKRTITLMAINGSPTTTNGCAEAVKVEAGTNDVDYWVLDFASDATEYAFWNGIWPDNWNAGTITAQFYWLTTSTTTSHDVRWELNVNAYGDNENIELAWAGNQGVSDAVATATAGYVYKSAATPALTVAGSPAAGDFVCFRVHRDHDHADDDMNVDARLLGIKITYTCEGYEDA